MRLELSKRIFLNFVIVISAFCILGALLGAHLINRNILNEAKRCAKTAESAGMAIIAAAPVQSASGEIIGALYAGVLLNRNHALVDKIRSIYFTQRRN